MSIAFEINIVAFILLVGMVIGGYHQGLLQSVYSIIRLFLSIVVAALLAPFVAPLLPNDWRSNQAIAFLIAFVIVAILLSVLNYALGLVNHVPIVGTVNKILGGAFGFVKWLFLLWLIIALISCFVHVQWCNDVMASIRRNEFLMWLDGFNPLHNFF